MNENDIYIYIYIYNIYIRRHAFTFHIFLPDIHFQNWKTANETPTKVNPRTLKTKYRRDLALSRCNNLNAAYQISI